MSLLLNFRDTFGERRARKVERDFNDRAALCGWHMAIRHDALEYERGGADFQDMKSDCQHALAFLRDLVRDTAGTGLVQDILIRVYDSLYWEEREVANSCLLAPFPWAHGFMRVSATGEDARMCIASNPLFQGLSGEDRNALARIVRSRHYGPGQVIIRECERGEEFFLIRSGKVLVSARERGRETTLAELTSGDSFGERALLGDLVRTASVKALTDTDLLVMGREDFDRIMKERSGGADMVDNAYHRQVDMLRRIPLFAELPVRQLQSLWSRLSLRKVKEGEVIVKKGEEGKEFFIIVTGEFTASTADDGADTVCGSPMKEGEYFGEIALLEEVPRTARVVACHDGELLVLEKDAFHSLLGYSPGLSRILSSTSRSRLQSDKKLLHGGKSR
jgi:CRP-like cAMP-binding protein